MPGEAPHPTDNPHWPAWFYPPETDPTDPTAAGRVFASADDVPDGWLIHWSHHGVNLEREPREPLKSILTRTELRAELTKRDVSFPPTAGVAELNKLLDEALADEALEGAV